MPQPTWQYLHPHAQVPYSHYSYPANPPNWPNRGPPIPLVHPTIPQANHLPSRAPYPSVLQNPTPGQMPPNQGLPAKPAPKPPQNSVHEPVPSPLHVQSQVPHSQPTPTTPQDRPDNSPTIAPVQSAIPQVNKSTSRESDASAIRNPMHGQKPPRQHPTPNPAVKPTRRSVRGSVPKPRRPHAKKPYSQSDPTTPSNRPDSWPPLTHSQPAIPQVNHSASQGSHASVWQNFKTGQKPLHQGPAPNPASKLSQSSVHEPVEPPQSRPPSQADDKSPTMRGGGGDEVDASKYSTLENLVRESRPDFDTMW
jgi:hypothetical protein